MSSPYDVLGLEPDASEQEIEQAFIRRVKESHPDLGGSAAEFQRVRAARDALREDGNGDGDWAPHAGYGESDDDWAVERSRRVEYLDYEVLADHGWDIHDDDLFEKAAAADLDPADYGRFLVEPDESLLEAAENRGFSWPFACRGGACANCAVAVADGDLSMPVDHILPSEMVDRGIRLSCCGAPTTDDMQVVYNVKQLPDLDELRLPPHPFNRAYPSD